MLYRSVTISTCTSTQPRRIHLCELAFEAAVGENDVQSKTFSLLEASRDMVGGEAGEATTLAAPPAHPGDKRVKLFWTCQDRNGQS